MPKSKLLGISSLAKETELSCVLLISLYQEREIQPQVWAALWEYIFQIRSHWSFTWEVISRWTKSAISSFSVSQSMVGNSESQLGVFTMWQAQRHFWSCQHRGPSNLLRNQMQQIKYRPQLSIWGPMLASWKKGLGGTELGVGMAEA